LDLQRERFALRVTFNGPTAVERNRPPARYAPRVTGASLRDDGLFGDADEGHSGKLPEQIVCPRVPDRVLAKFAWELSLTFHPLPTTGLEIGMDRALWNFLRVKGCDLINVVVQPIGVEQVGMSAPTHTWNLRRIVVGI
jgi:hypothetical protein